MNRFKVRNTAAVFVVFLLLVYLNNTAFLAETANATPSLVAHRGLAQDFDREGLTGKTCTAARMIPVGHEYLENTIPSMRAAFAYGADFVELDVHPTIDGRFAVFHDWTIDCRTEGQGVTREHSLADLQMLDIGYGYTADQGASYPFRGRGVGMMPSLRQVFEAFPDEGLIINIKGQDPEEGKLLIARLAEFPLERQEQLVVYGGGQATDIIREQLPKVRTLSKSQLKSCLIQYAALGWTGYVPTDCRRSMLLIPANFAPWLWGWPDRLLQRMEEAGTHVFLAGDYRGGGVSTGLNELEHLTTLPENYAGGIWTDRIDLLGPALKGTKHNL